ncbi:MAG: hypothetical protein Q9201_002334 [Fulgogasparrea decipioides]
MSASTQILDPRVVVTGHTGNGTSIFISDEHVTQLAPFGPEGSTFAKIHSQPSVPVSNQNLPPDLTDQTPRNPPNGVMFCTADFKAGTQTPMHRTQSLDYCGIISGEIVLILDTGDEKTLRAGELVVQRGANHAWANRTEENCRIMFVTVAAEKVKTEDGKELGDGDVFMK